MRERRKFPIRILIIEDDPERELLLTDWLPRDVRPVVATSAGSAIGLISRDRGRVYAGVILDHDLQDRRLSEADRHLSGQDVVEAIIEHFSREILILVHSVNASQSVVMTRRLQQAGFDVVQIPMTILTKERLSDWLEEVRESLDL